MLRGNKKIVIPILISLIIFLTGVSCVILNLKGKNYLDVNINNYTIRITTENYIVEVGKYPIEKTYRKLTYKAQERINKNKVIFNKLFYGAYKNYEQLIKNYEYKMGMAKDSILKKIKF